MLLGVPNYNIFHVSELPKNRKTSKLHYIVLILSNWISDDNDDDDDDDENLLSYNTFICAWYSKKMYVLRKCFQGGLKETFYTETYVHVYQTCNLFCVTTFLHAFPLIKNLTDHKIKAKIANISCISTLPCN